MAQPMTATEHRTEALRLLAMAQGYAPAPASARPVLLAEAQVHATLALSAPEKAAPARKPRAKATKAAPVLEAFTVGPETTEAKSA